MVSHADHHRWLEKQRLQALEINTYRARQKYRGALKFHLRTRHNITAGTLLLISEMERIHNTHEEQEA